MCHDICLFNDMMLEVAVRVVDIAIAGIVDHHCCMKTYKTYT